MLVSSRPDFLAEALVIDHRGEVDGSLPLVTCFAEHNAKVLDEQRRATDDRHEVETPSGASPRTIF